ncbi:DUF397 domain-containing protein [Nocardiopsis sp. LOL_012]|uniref:DUF397 domain-containing protein n=1 Tax=Nocardiopsis sp. LOL_012 TaxID=3345409 RepID=UPI003A8C307D
MDGNAPRWFKSSYSSAESHHCVEVAFGASEGVVWMRDSLSPRTGRLQVDPCEWSFLVRSVGASSG